MLLRPWVEADGLLLARLASDRRVIRYIGSGQPWSGQRSSEISAWLVEHWRGHGFGWRVAIEKATGEPVGLIALNYLRPGTAGLNAGEFEVGWWLAPEAWGRGFALEGGRAILEEAFERLGAPSAVARIQPANSYSARVAEGLGMVAEFDTTGVFGEPVRVYRVRPPA